MTGTGALQTRKGTTSALAVSCACPLFELEFGDVGFCVRWKTGEPGEKASEQGKNQQETQPMYDTGLESNPGRNGGKRLLPPNMLPIKRLLILFLLFNFTCLRCF